MSAPFADLPLLEIVSAELLALRSASERWRLTIWLLPKLSEAALFSADIVVMCFEVDVASGKVSGGCTT